MADFGKQTNRGSIEPLARGNNHLPLMHDGRFFHEILHRLNFIASQNHTAIVGGHRLLHHAHRVRSRGHGRSGHDPYRLSPTDSCSWPTASDHFVNHFQRDVLPVEIGRTDRVSIDQRLTMRRHVHIGSSIFGEVTLMGERKLDRLLGQSPNLTIQ